MRKHDERFEMRFQAERKSILKSLDSKSKMRGILFQKKKVNLSVVGDS